MTSILVTGGGGFIGRQVACAVSQAGYDVTAMARKQVSNTAQRMIQRDLRAPLDNLPAVDWVFHLAGGYAGAGHAALERADLRIANNVIGWGLETGIKNWIFASAAEVYGDVHGIATEEAPTRPVIPYGRIKLMVERLLMEHFKDLSDCRVVILRIGEVYGSKGRLITELAARLKRGFCPWPGSGRVQVSFVHVNDVAQAFVCAAQRAPLGVSVYNVADDRPATWLEFLSLVTRLCAARPPVYLPMPLVRAYAACSAAARLVTAREAILTKHALRLITTPKALSNAHLKRALGFQPRYPSYSEGLEEALSGLSYNA